MKEGFEKDLRSVSQAERMRRGEIEVSEEIENIHEEIKARLNEMVSSQGIAENEAGEVSKKILEIQRKKLNIMKKLREELADLDEGVIEEGERVIKKERPATFDVEKKSFVYKDERGNEVGATFGEILTDIDWGIEYNLEDESIPRMYKKHYLVEKAKAELRELLDRQILISEINNTENDDRLISVYQSIFASSEERRKNGNEEDKYEQGGFLAETMVQNFLKQLAIDNDLPFEIKVSDVQQDVELKMDFIVHKKQAGVGVEVKSGDYEDVAIQYSLNQEKEELKQKQIKRTEKRLIESEADIKHVALVVFPIDDLNKIKNEWKKKGKLAGGPSKLMNEEVKERLFFALLNDLFSQDEIQGFWNKAQKDL